MHVTKCLHDILKILIIVLVQIKLHVNLLSV